MVVSLVEAQATGCGGEEVCQQVRDWSNEFDEDLQRWPKALRGPPVILLPCGIAIVGAQPEMAVPR
jgi:hypothetical protein